MFKNHIFETIIETLAENIRSLERGAEVFRKELVQARSDGSHHRNEAMSLAQEVERHKKEIQQYGKDYESIAELFNSIGMSRPYCNRMEKAIEEAKSIYDKRLKVCLMFNELHNMVDVDGHLSDKQALKRIKEYVHQNINEEPTNDN